MTGTMLALIIPNQTYQYMYIHVSMPLSTRDLLSDCYFFGSFHLLWNNYSSVDNKLSEKYIQLVFARIELQAWPSVISDDLQRHKISLDAMRVITPTHVNIIPYAC